MHALLGSIVKPLISMLAVLALVGGCGGSTAPSDATSAAPTEAEATPAPAIVGTWVGMHACERIVEMFLDAGMEGQILPTVVDNGLLPGVSDVAEVADPADPCSEAVDQEHSHFFTAAGSFGSRDGRGQQVDDGTWLLFDADTISINGTQFDFEVVGDELQLSPVDVGSCPANSTAFYREAWKLMVAMPGMAWTRDS